MANTPNTIPTKRLAATIDGSATLIKLNNILDWSGTTLTSAYLGDVLYAVLRDQDNTVIEIMQLDPTTIANNSTTGITILRRGLKFNGDLTTEVSANKLVWVKNQTIVEIGTDVPQIFQNFVNVTDDQSVAGVKTFSSFPQKSGSTTPTQAAELATKAYVDATATGSATYDQNIFSGIAGETLVATDLCYFKQSDQRWWKADADAIATSVGVKLAIAQGGATAGNALNLLGSGVNKNFSGLTVSSPYFVSNTAGGISTTPGTYSRFIGRAISATTLHFDPDNGNVVSKYGIEIYGADSVGTDAYAITTSSPFLALKDGMVIRFKAGTTNTGAATLSVDGLTAKTIKKNYNVTLADGDIKAGQITQVVYDSANDCFQMQSQVGNNSVPSQLISTPYLAAETLAAGDPVSNWYYQADGGVAYETKGTWSQAAAGATVTQSLTCGTGSNRILVVGIMTFATTPNPTYAGVAMTSAGSQSLGGGQNFYVYYLFAPATGANNLVYSNNAGNNTSGSFFQLTGSHQSAIDSFVSAVADNQTVTPTTDAPMLVHFSVSSQAGTTPTGAVNFAANTQTIATGVGARIYSGTSGHIFPKIPFTASSSTTVAVFSLLVRPITAPTFGYAVKTSAATNTGGAASAAKWAAFMGFANGAATLSNAVDIVTSGVMTGLSSLIPGATHYLSDTSGTLSTTAGTNSKKVGTALSTTTLLIKMDN